MDGDALDKKIMGRLQKRELSKPNWTTPTKNESTERYQGYDIYLGQGENGKWRWAVLEDIGEDNTDVTSRSEAIRQAKDMIDSVLKD